MGIHITLPKITIPVYNDYYYYYCQVVSPFMNFYGKFLAFAKISVLVLIIFVFDTLSTCAHTHMYYMCSICTCSTCTHVLTKCVHATIMYMYMYMCVSL